MKFKTSICDDYNNRRDGLMILIKGNNKMCNQLLTQFNLFLDLAIKQVYPPILSRYMKWH